MSRAQRAAEQAADYTVRITRRDSNGAAAYVSRGEDRRYGVQVSLDGLIACSCPDAMHRGTICKHAWILMKHLEAN